MALGINYKTPRQRLTYKQKTKDWRKSNVDNADQHSIYYSSSVRQTLRNKIINLNLYNGIVDIRDLTAIVNPNNVDASYIPDNIPHHPIMVPKVDLLGGEEIKRRFDWNVIVTNSDAISKKEEDKKAMLVQKMTEFLQSNYQEEELEKKFKELEDYMRYDWQDLREKMANQILRHYWGELDFEQKFNFGFKDVLLFAEAIFQVDIVADEPTMEKLNPLKVHTIRSGNSSRIEDSSIIILEDHWAPGKIIDYFHEELKPADVDYIMDYNATSSKSGEYDDDDNNHALLADRLPGINGVESIFNLAEVNGHYFSSDLTDDEGNIRVFRVYWRSLKKIQKVKYYDNDGETQYKIMSEEYVLNEALGEESTTLWVNEWWEGTKIGKDIYVNMRPRQVQFNRLSNPSTCHPGVIGEVFNTNQGRAVSLVDRCKNYQYMYDVIWDRLNKAISTNYGKIFELDLAKVPENWEMEKWLHFAIVNKIAVVDSFKEGSKGAATGKLAGGVGAGVGGRSIDMETGNYIQQHVQLLEFIKMEMGEIAGVSKQREGAIHQNETASGVERSVNQSSHITEYWFHNYEKLKLRVLSAFLETAKIALKGNNKKVQYLLDDQSIQLLNMDGDIFSEADYGLVCSSSSRSTELENSMKQLAQAFMQNGGSFTTIMDIYFSPSLSDMRRKIEREEEKLNERNAKVSEDANKQAQAQLQQEAQLEQAKLQLEDTKSIRDSETKIYIAELKANSEGADLDGDGINDALENEKFGLDKQKAKDDMAIKMKALDNNMKQHNDKMVREDKKIAVSKIKKPTK